MKNTVPSLTAVSVTSLLVCTALVGTGSQAAAQQKKKAPPAAAAKKTTGPIVLGTTQLPGDFGKIGQTYTIGKSSPINVTLDSVRYTADRFVVGTQVIVPTAEQKLMVLRYTIHNPLPQDQRFYWADLRFTVVDATDTNHKYVQAARRAGIQEVSFDQYLKPAQKVQLETAILVPANGEMPKLIVEREQGAPVIRYDLRGKVAPLPAPLADPADATGATALKDASFPAGQTAPAGNFDLKLESVAYTNEALAGQAVKPGYRNVAATFTLKNVTTREARYYWGDFEAIGKDADGEKVPYTQAMLRASRNESLDSKLAPGEEVKVRFFFAVPEKVDAKSISIRERYYSQNNGRWATFDLAGAASSTSAAAATP